jgi:chorismate-pyruvate lyase
MTADDKQTRQVLGELLAKSEGLQRRSEQLAAEAEAIRVQIQALLAAESSAERRQKPRIRGK